MKKRILCAIMSAVMVVGVMTGCGSKETTSNKNVENVSDKSDKTEEKYAERMEAYLDYFQSEEKDYDGVVAAAITLDSDSLPLLWLAYMESEESEDIRFQLCTYEKNKIEILAEKGIDNVADVAPYIADGITGLHLSIGDDEYSDNSKALIYNHEDQDFDFYDADYFEYDNYKNDDVDEYYKKMQKDIDAYRVMKTPSKIIIANTESKTAYLGLKDSYEIYSDMLNNMNALEEITVANAGAGVRLGYRLQEKFTNDKPIKDIFDEYFLKVENKNYDDYGDYYNIKSSFTLPDGTETDDEGFYKYYDLTYDDYRNLRNAVYDDEPVMSIQELDTFTRFTSGKDAEFMMRNLIKDSAYTSFDLMLMFGKLNEDIYNGMYNDLRFGDIVDAKELLKDAANNKDNSVDSTESTESIKREDSTEISKETNNNMPAWKQAYIDYFNNSNLNVLDSKFIDTENKDIHLLACSIDNGSIDGKLFYINKKNEVVEIAAYTLNRAVVRYNKYGAISILNTPTLYDSSFRVYEYDENSGSYPKTYEGFAALDQDSFSKDGEMKYNCKINGNECDYESYQIEWNTYETGTGFEFIELSDASVGVSVIDTIKNY